MAFLLNGFRSDFCPSGERSLLQTVFFAALHMGKPTPELLSSLPRWHFDGVCSRFAAARLFPVFCFTS